MSEKDGLEDAFTELAAAAVTMNELFRELVAAGFTRDEALRLVALIVVGKAQ